MAEEVRSLAQRSAAAAKSTADLIDEAGRNAGSGVAANQEVLESLAEINRQVQRVSEVMAEIAAASEQQGQGVAQINGAVEQMNQVTQSTAANAEESASAAEELSGQEAEMQALAAGFRLSQGNSHVTGGPAWADLLRLLPSVAADPTAAGRVRLIAEAVDEAAERVRRLQRIVRLEEAHAAGATGGVLDLDRSAPPAPAATPALG